MQTIAIDPGYGNTKACIDGRTAVVQSAVVKPVHVGAAQNGVRMAEAAQRVQLDGMEFMVGKGAWLWGRAMGSMDYTTIVSPERLALMYAAISAVAEPGDLGERQLIIGLPVPLMQDEGQMGAVREALKRMKRPHHFETDMGRYQFSITGISARMQPMGAFFDWLYNDDLQRRDGGTRADIAIVDIGMNTLDLFVVEAGTVRPGFLGGDKAGVRRLLDLVATNGYDISERDAMLRDGRLKARDGELDIWLAEILGVIERTWPSLKRFTGVILTGGGAIVLGQKLGGALAAKGAALYWPEDPVIANVKGLWKYGAKHLAGKGATSNVGDGTEPEKAGAGVHRQADTGSGA